MEKRGDGPEELSQIGHDANAVDGYIGGGRSGELFLGQQEPHITGRKLIMQVLLCDALQ